MKETPENKTVAVGDNANLTCEGYFATTHYPGAMPSRTEWSVRTTRDAKFNRIKGYPRYTENISTR